MSRFSRTNDPSEILLSTLPFPACTCSSEDHGITIEFTNSEWRLRESWPQSGIFAPESEVGRACLSLRKLGLSTIVPGPEESWLAVTCLKKGLWSLMARSEPSFPVSGQTWKAEKSNLLGVFDASEDCILVVGSQGIVRYANRAAHTMLGQDHLVEEAFPLSLNGVGTQELELRRVDGQMVIAEMTTQSTSWNGVSVWLVVLRDVTELRLKDLQLRQAQKMEVVGQLAGGIAHDFNNLLMVIGGHVDLLADQLSSHHPGFADLEELHKAIRMGTVLASKLLTFSREKPMTMRSIEVNSALEEVGKTLGRLLRDDVSLSLALSDSQLFIEIDYTDLTQILMNLVLNAQDAIRRAGEITIGCRSVLESQNGRARRIEIFVRDNGVGMSTAVLERAFEPFFSTKNLDEGTGLGLAVIHRLVEQYGGGIEVKSSEGKGTMFKLFFPLSNSPQDSQIIEEETCRIDHDFQSIRILLVDDHELVRNASRRFLERLGYDVTTSGCAEDALELVEQQGERYELLITDVVMPGMNGFQLATCLQEIDPQLRALFMSGYTGLNLPTTRDLIADRILKKPFGLAELRNKLSEILESTSLG